MSDTRELRETPHEDPPWFYENQDFLLRCPNQAAADKYVDDILSIASRADMEKLVRAVYQISKKDIRSQPTPTPRPRPVANKRRGKRKTGGAALGIHDTNDINIYNLLTAADTYHDFELVEDVVMPEEYSELTNSRSFVKAMTTHPSLTFNGKKIANPLYKADLNCPVDIVGEYDKNNGLTVDELFRMQQSKTHGRMGADSLTVPVDIFTEVTPPRTDQQGKKQAILKLFQVAQTIGIMSKLYGSDTSWVIDANGNNLIIILIAFKYIRISFDHRFIIDPYVEYVSMLPAKLQELLKQLNIPEVTWEVKTTDANLFDAADNPLSLPNDSRPTGPVFRKECKYQIELKGIEITDRRYVNATITEENGTVHDLRLHNKDTVKMFSVNAIKNMPALRNPNSKTKVKPATTDIEKEVRTFPEDLLMGIKRAGDWGQVEHCKRYSKTFVTGDRLAAMYAWYRGVRFVYVQYQEHLENDLPHFTRFFRYSFVMSRAHL